MNRRRFLESLLGGAIAAHQLDIEKLLWVPGKKRIFIPPADNSSIWLVTWSEVFIAGLRPRYWDPTTTAPEDFTGLAPRYLGREVLSDLTWIELHS